MAAKYIPVQFLRASRVLSFISPLPIKALTPHSNSLGEVAPTHIAGLPVAVNIQCHCVRCEKAGSGAGKPDRFDDGVDNALNSLRRFKHIQP